MPDIINEHAPIEERVIKARKPAYMNGNLRRAVFKKRMLFNKFKKSKTSANWELYRKQRNHVTKLKKASMRVYFFERCAGGPKSKNFWHTIKPFLSKKGSNGGSEVILCQENKVISDQAEVCTLFNSFFANVATDIGKDCHIENLEEHPSIQMIQQNLPSNIQKFSFRPVTDSEITKILSNIDSKKSTGVDNIPAKIVKSCSSPISGVLANLINTTFHHGKFPASLKGAQVVPIHKKNDPLDKENYRPVSVLPIISKAYERVMHNQLCEYFNDIFNPFLATFRKGFGCQSTLLRLLEDWRKALDNHESAAAVLMDLSKAFDCLPHGLLIEKLRAYGFASDAIDLLSSYLNDIVQQVRLGSHTSTWEKIIKGVPQGSILGPLLFNVFLNDIFFFVNQAVIYNYADDNTLSFIHANIEVLKKVLEDESCILIDWFFKNFMKANPSKFQAICIGKNAHDGITSFNIDSVEIKCDDNVTLLGINIDFMLRFDDHVSEICKKASKQLAVLKRLGRFLTRQGKMTIYNSFIVSNFNYCLLAWHFCSASSTNKIEKIQERALRFINNDFTSSLQALLTSTNTLLVHVRRMKQMASEIYKIVNDIAPAYIKDLVNIKKTNYNFRRENQASLPAVKSTRYGLRSFRYEAARIWNCLPNDVRQAESFPQFKRLLRAWSSH